jgi:F-type H+-transporting ATPase subunit c
MEMLVLKYVGAGLACFGMIGAGIGVGNIFSALVNGTARNPSVEPKLFKNALIGAALAEALGLLAFVIAIMSLGGGAQ